MPHSATSPDVSHVFTGFDSRLRAVEGFVAETRSSMGKMERDLHGLVEAFNRDRDERHKNSRVSWPLILSVVGTIVAIATVAAAVIGLVTGALDKEDHRLDSRVTQMEELQRVRTGDLATLQAEIISIKMQASTSIALQTRMYERLLTLETTSYTREDAQYDDELFARLTASEADRRGLERELQLRGRRE